MSWQLIESQTLGSSQASVTLGSGGTIPQTYKTLKLVVSARSTTGDANIWMTVNSIASGYSGRMLAGTGSAAASSTDSTGTKVVIGVSLESTRTSSTFSSTTIELPNYAGSTNKAFSSDSVEENNATATYMELIAALLSNTAAITSITLSADPTAAFATNSSFTLYGLR